MRKSRVLGKLRQGNVVISTKLNLMDARVAELAAMCGFDCIWLCMEHVPTDWATIENQIRAAKIYDVDTLVRISRGSYSDYVLPLEADAAGIMVPHLMSSEDAKKVVRQTRFHPLGRRPVDGGNADGRYCMLDFKEYIKEANTQRFVIIQIEDPEPLDELEAIAAVDGIDMLFFGPGDYSHAIGKAGETEHPDLEPVLRRIAGVARHYNRFAGTTGNFQNIDRLVDMGYQFINIGADVLGLGQYYQQLAGKLHKYL
jgi:4-hydroxy-2-oxoheptanedioate aldolase